MNTNAQKRLSPFRFPLSLFTSIAVFSFSISLFTSCSNDEVFEQDSTKDTPITISAGVADLATRAGYMTDATDDTKSVLPETFYLTVIQTEDESQYNYNNMVMEKTAGENQYTPIGNMLWYEADRSPFVSAYTIEGTTFTVQTDQRNEANVIASDLLGAVKKSGETSDDVTIAGDNICISFRHLLCKLDVTFSWGTEFNTDNKSIESVVYSGFGTSVTLNREDRTVTADETATDITAYMNGTTSEAIFAPYVGTAPKIVITTYIDDVERIFSIGVNPPVAGFASGNCYTMNVTIGGTTVEDAWVTANIAKGWETGDANGDEYGATGNMTTK